MEEQLVGKFWLGIFFGVLLMVIFGAVLPMIGLVIGGIAAGFIAGPGYRDGAKAGFFAGIIDACIITILFLAGARFLLEGISVAGILEASLFFLIILFPLVGLLGLLGGIIGGILRSRINHE